MCVPFHFLLLLNHRRVTSGPINCQPALPACLFQSYNTEREHIADMPSGAAPPVPTCRESSLTAESFKALKAFVEGLFQVPILHMGVTDMHVRQGLLFSGPQPRKL